MPYKDADPEDPQELVGVGFPADDETHLDMAYVFAEEFARLGFSEQRLVHLFRNPFYRSAHQGLADAGRRENHGDPADDETHRRPMYLPKNLPGWASASSDWSICSGTLSIEAPTRAWRMLGEERITAIVGEACQVWGNIRVIDRELSESPLIQLQVPGNSENER